MKKIYIIVILLIGSIACASEDYFAQLEKNKNIDMFSKKWKESDEYEEYKILKSDNDIKEAKKIKINFYNSQEVFLISKVLKDINFKDKQKIISTAAKNLPTSYILAFNKIYKKINLEIKVKKNKQRQLYILLHDFFYFTYMNENTWSDKKGKSKINLDKLLKEFPKLKSTIVYNDLRELSKKSDGIYFNYKKLHTKKLEKIGDKEYEVLYWENGKVKSKRRVVNGKKDGVGYDYYKTGDLKRKYLYKNNKKMSLIMYFENGKKKLEKKYKNGKVNGLVASYYENGNIKSKKEYRKGKLFGTQKIYYKNGSKKKFFGFTKEGKLIFTTWYENGKKEFDAQYKGGFNIEKFINSKTRYKYKEKFLLSKTWYHDNGNKKSYAEMNNGDFNGKYIWYYKNGKIAESYKYKNGKAEGNVKGYYNDGKKYFEGSYKNDKKSGKWKYYSSFYGHVYKIINYKDGLKNGLYTKYKEYAKYKFNKKHTEIIKRDVLNYKQYTINYKKGKREGKFTEYDYDKHIVKEVDYKNGKKNGKYLEYYYSNKLSKNIKISEIIYKNAKREGKATWWYKSGVIKKESYFKSDMLDGIEKEYRYDGLLVKKSSYKKNTIEKYLKYQTYGLKGALKIETKVLSDGRLKFIEYFTRWGKNDKKVIFVKWYTVNGLKNGQYIQYNKTGTIDIEYKYQNGIKLSSRYYYSSGELFVDQIFNQLTKVYKRTRYNKKGNILEIFSYTKNYDSKVGKHIRYSYDGKKMLEDIYDSNSKLVSSKNYLKKDLKNIVQKYKNDKSKGLAYYWLDLEKEYGFDISDAKNILDNLVSKVKQRIILRSSYNSSQARDVMNTIGDVIKNAGIVYDTKHIDIFSQTLENKAMDCDIISILYVTIGDKLNLPIYSVIYPGHMALKWKDNYNNFLWEATSHQEMNLYEYKESILYSWNATNGVKKHGYATELNEKEIFAHIFSLLSMTIKDWGSRQYFEEVSFSLSKTFLLNFANIEDKELLNLEPTRLKIYGKNDYYNNYILANAFRRNLGNPKLSNNKIIELLSNSYQFLPDDEYKKDAISLLLYAYKNLEKFESVISMYEELIEVDYSNRTRYKKKLNEYKKKLNEKEAKKENKVNSKDKES